MSDGEVRELFGEVPYWAGDAIREYKPVEDYAQDFITESYWSCCASVNLGELRGMAQLPDCGHSWRQFICSDQKMQANLKAFKENPAYYTGLPERNPSMYFVRVNGRLYVGGDGRYRATIGKFYLYSQPCPYLHHVELHDYSVDFEFMRVYREFVAKKPSWLKAEVAHLIDHREDGVGWKRDYYQQLTVHVTDTRSGLSSVHDKFSLAEAVSALEHKAPSLFSRILRRAA